MFKEFGSTKEVFVNQDEGMFVAFPITLDSNALTLETETRNGRTYVLAGSVVKEGSIVRGILAEEYDITYGPVAGRVVLEGYAWASRLTANALASLSSLPKIIAMPYKYLVVEIKEIDDENHKVVIRCAEGSKFADYSASNFTFTGTEPTGGALNSAKDELTLTFAAATEGSITAIAAAAFIGSPSSVVKGLPLEYDC